MYGSPIVRLIFATARPGEFATGANSVAVQREADVGDRYALGEESLFISGLDRQQVVRKSGAVNVGVARPLWVRRCLRPPYACSRRCRQSLLRWIGPPGRAGSGRSGVRNSGAVFFHTPLRSCGSGNVIQISTTSPGAKQESMNSMRAQEVPRCASLFGRGFCAAPHPSAP